jgi:SAM-dependent methyltransferase
MDEQQRNVESGAGGECWSAWANKDDAREYFQQTAQSKAAKARLNDLCRLAKPASRILDIGAGAGNMALPLSKIAAHLTAVEPSPGMLSIMKDQLSLENTENIMLVEKRWDDVDIERDLEPPYTLCFAAFSLGMLNLQESIEKMIAATTGDIVLFWHAGLNSRDEDAIALWPLLHGKPYYPAPRSNVIFNLLYSMGIYPNVTVLRHNERIVYESFDKVFEHYAARYNVKSEAQSKVLIGYLRRKFSPYGKRTVIRFTHNISMRLAWQTQIVTQSRIG